MNNYIYENQSQHFICMQSQKRESFLISHNLPKLIYMVEGDARLTYNGKIYNFRSGDFILIFPGIVHSITSQAIMRRIVYNFNQTTFPHLLSVFHDKQIAGNPIINIADLSFEVSFCIKQVLADENLLQQNTRAISYLGIILSNLLNTYKLEESQINTATQVNLMQQIISYLNKNFRKDITLNDLSRQFLVSSYQISRIFKSNVGKSIPQYLNTIRAEYSAVLLSESDLTITEIAFESGFFSLPTFFRVFKETHLLSPRKYREQHKIDDFRWKL